MVVVAEGIPVHDTLEVRAAALACGAMIIGGNTSGVITPRQGHDGHLPLLD